MSEALALQKPFESFAFPLSPEPEIVLLTAVVDALHTIENESASRAEKEANVAWLFARHRFDAENNPNGLTEPEFRLLRFQVEDKTR